MPFKSRAHNLVMRILARWERGALNALFLAAYLLVMLRLWWPMRLPGQPGWPDAVLLLLGVVGTIAALARHLPFQNVLGAAFVIAFAGGATDWLCCKTGIPFGLFTPGENSGPQLFHALPWAMPVVWVLAILNSRGVARLILRPWRKLHAYGFWLMGVTAVLTVLFDLAFEPFASRVKDYWIWEPTKFPLSWQGVPLVNFLGWLVVTLLILAFITPMLINKRPIHRRPPDFHPLGVWLGSLLLFGAGSATAGLWSAVLLNGMVGVTVAIFAVRGARW